jgi:hypothetical protein
VKWHNWIENDGDDYEQPNPKQLARFQCVSTQRNAIHSPIRNQVFSDDHLNKLRTIEFIGDFATLTDTISDRACCGCKLNQRNATQGAPMACDTLRSAVINLRVTPELRARLERIAAADHRTLSNMIELILERACDQAERDRKRR